MCPWLCTAASSLSPPDGDEAGTPFQELSRARDGTAQSLPVAAPDPLPTAAGKQFWRKSPYLVSKVLDDKGLI